MIGMYHDRLPHWVVDYGCYALTFHCADSLPAVALEKLREIVASDRSVESSDDAFLEESRRRFKIMEHYLDQSYGTSPFKADSLRQAMHEFLEDFDGVFRFRHWVMMPNHLHLLTEPMRFESTNGFKRAIKDFKMKSTFFANRELDRSGRLWMTSDYDRWVRDVAEYRRWVKYLQANPVKAGLCRQPSNWVGLK